MNAKRTDKALREIEKRYRLLFNSISDMILVYPLHEVSTPQRLVEVNDVACQRLGYTREEMLRMTTHDIGAAEAVAAVPQMTARLREEGLAVWEGMLRTRSGPAIPVEISNRLFDLDGKPMVVATVRDITERKQAEEAIRESQEHTRAIMESALDAIVTIDDKGNITYWNSAAERILGYPRAETIGRNLHDMITPERFLPAHRAAFPEFQRSGHGSGLGATHELAARRKDGREIDIALSLSAMRIKGSWHAIGIVQDITERKKAEEKLRQSEARLRRAELASKSGNWELHLESETVLASEGAQKIYGSFKDTLDYAVVKGFPLPEYRPMLDASLRSLIEEDLPSAVEYRIRAADSGAIKDIRSIATFDREKRVVFGVIQDITEQKALQAQIMRAQRLESLSRLAGGIAHQFNNINTIVMGYLGVLAREADLSEAARSCVHEALKGLERAVNITERMQGLTVTRGGGQKGVSLNEIVRALVPTFEARVREQGAQVILELPEIQPVRMNLSQLNFIVASLFSNAIDSLLGCPRRIVTIRCGEAEGLVFLEVGDTGRGIPTEDLTGIFTPFFTTKGEWAPQGSPQSMVKGVGLSLAVCQSTVSESGGRIEVESKVGVGSTFRAWLPTDAGIC